MTKEPSLVYLVKFMGYPVKQIHAENYYQITAELSKLIVIYKCPPEWIVRQA